MTFTTVQDLLAALAGVVEVTGDSVTIQDESALRSTAIDTLVWNSTFADGAVQETARWLILELGQLTGARPASIHELYIARGQGTWGGATVPAINLRGMTYDAARAVFRAARRLNVGTLILEIARSEIGYTQQRPAEYTSSILAAAIKEGFTGPIFLQGDHFQAKAAVYSKDANAERGAIQQLIREAIAAGFYNIDIDASTLVDLSQPTLDEQQRTNYELTAEFTAFVRGEEPAGVTVSLGGEIGEVGGKNSTVEELTAFLEGFDRTLDQIAPGTAGLSKISVQTGTSHGGVVLPDGTLAKVKVDFDTLRNLSAAAREQGLGGAVQHGASTLPPEAFGHFPDTETLEIHLATGFQNIIYDYEGLSDEFRQRVYAYLKDAHANEWKSGQTEEQFIYKTRKKGFGPFKKEWWSLPEDVRTEIGQRLEDQFAFLFEKLNVPNTTTLVAETVTVPTVHKPRPS